MNASEALSGKKLAFIGCGTMGEAILATLLHNNIVSTDQIIGSEPVVARREDLARRYGINMTGSNAEAVQGADLIMLTIKPQSLDSIAKDLRGKLTPDQVVVSILAGASIASITNGLDHQAVVRAMPNTPSQIGQGMTVWMATPAVSDDQQVEVAAALGAMGQAVQVTSENEVDMATALSGTGPAYVFLMMESLIDAGVHMGFSRRVAEELVLQTMIGSVLFAKDSGKHPAELRNMVTSPGGTSASAIYQMEKGSLRTVISRAVWAAYQRTQELGQGENVQPPPPSVR
jgi:pyrroline-5-carboxylate reductase